MHLQPPMSLNVPARGSWGSYSGRPDSDLGFCSENSPCLPSGRRAGAPWNYCIRLGVCNSPNSPSTRGASTKFSRLPPFRACVPKCSNAEAASRRRAAPGSGRPGPRPLLGWHLNARLDSSAPAWSRLPIFIHFFCLWLPLLCAALWRLKPKYRRRAPKASGKSYLPAGRDRNASPRSLGKRIARNGLGPRAGADLGRAK